MTNLELKFLSRIIDFTSFVVNDFILKNGEAIEQDTRTKLEMLYFLLVKVSEATDKEIEKMKTPQTNN